MASPWLRINPLTTIIGDSPQEMKDASLVLGLYSHRPVEERCFPFHYCKYGVTAMEEDGSLSEDPEDQGWATFLVGLN